MKTIYIQTIVILLCFKINTLYNNHNLLYIIFFESKKKRYCTETNMFLNSFEKISINVKRGEEIG